MKYRPGWSQQSALEENLRNLREQVAESSLDASLSQGLHSCACLEQTTSSQAARSAQPEKAALGRLQLQLPRCPAVDHRTLTRQPLSDLREQGKGKGRKSFNFNSSSSPFPYSSHPILIVLCTSLFRINTVQINPINPVNSESQ